MHIVEEHDKHEHEINIATSNATELSLLLMQ